MQLLEAEEDAQGKAHGAVLVVEGWQCLWGQASSSSSKKRHGQGQQLTPADLAAACIEVSAWRVQQEVWGDDDGGRVGKRPRVGPRPVFAEVRGGAALYP